MMKVTNNSDQPATSLFQKFVASLRIGSSNQTNDGGQTAGQNTAAYVVQMHDLKRKARRYFNGIQDHSLGSWTMVSPTKAEASCLRCRRTHTAQIVLEAGRLVLRYGSDEGAGMCPGSARYRTYSRPARRRDADLDSDDLKDAAA